ncbi:MAG: glycosyltransferase [bacterium]|nr:glycosyltransferase [bacterium]
MNILYCGDENIEDGLMISVLSILKNVDADLHFYVMTMTLKNEDHSFYPVNQKVVQILRDKLREVNVNNSIELFDATSIFQKMIPSANMQTRFTPYCMLRLFADQVSCIPDKILYLDNDVICRQSIKEFYEQDMEKYEIAGVLDYYGRFFFRNRLFHMDYLNSGVLLLNIKKIRETGLFEMCRKMCQEKKMFMPDQSALNKLCQRKRIAKRKFNEQRILHQDTVLQHFTTSFRFLPWIHTITVKPWQVEKVHSKLKLFEYDDILEEYLKAKACIRGN